MGKQFLNNSLFMKKNMDFLSRVDGIIFIENNATPLFTMGLKNTDVLSSEVLIVSVGQRDC